MNMEGFSRANTTRESMFERNLSSASLTAASASHHEAFDLTNIQPSTDHLDMVQLDYDHYLADKPGLTIIFCACLSIASVCGTLGNILVMLSVLTDRFLRQPCNAFIINLAIADFLVSLVVHPFNVLAALYGAQAFKNRNWLCILVGMVCTPSCVASLYNIMAIAVSRYVRICKYQYYHDIFTWSTSTWMCVAIWSAGLLIHSPNHFGWGETAYAPDYYICTFSIEVHSYALFWLFTSIVVPLVVITACYINIYLHYKRSRAALLAHKTTHSGRHHHHHSHHHDHRRPYVLEIIDERNRRRQQHQQQSSLSLLENSNTNPQLADDEDVDEIDHCRSTAADAGTCSDNSKISSRDNLLLREEAVYTAVGNNAVVVDDDFSCQRHNNSVVVDTASTAAATANVEGERVPPIVIGNNNTTSSTINNNSSSNKEEAERKLLFTLILVLAAFIICWVPFLILVASHSPRWIPGWIYVFSIILCHGNSTLNVFIYGLTNPNFRAAYKRLIYILLCQSKKITQQQQQQRRQQLSQQRRGSSRMISSSSFALFPNNNNNNSTSNIAPAANNTTPQQQHNNSSSSGSGDNNKLPVRFARFAVENNNNKSQQQQNTGISSSCFSTQQRGTGDDDDDNDDENNIKQRFTASRASARRPTPLLAPEHMINLPPHTPNLLLSAIGGGDNSTNSSALQSYSSSTGSSVGDVFSNRASSY